MMRDLKDYGLVWQRSVSQVSCLDLQYERVPLNGTTYTTGSCEAQLYTWRAEDQRKQHPTCQRKVGYCDGFCRCVMQVTVNSNFRMRRVRTADL